MLWGIPRPLWGMPTLCGIPGATLCGAGFAPDAIGDPPPGVVLGMLLGSGSAPPGGFAGLKPIATVRATGFFFGTIGPSALPGSLPGVDGGRFGAFVISCVPGFFRTGAGGGETEPRALSLAASTACWKAPRCESALLTASGETCEPSLPGGGRDFDAGGGELDVSGFVSIEIGAAACAPMEPAAAVAPRASADESGAGGGPYRLGTGEFGDAVAANGLTCEGGSYPLCGTLTLGALETFDGLEGAAAARPLIVLGPCSPDAGGGCATGAPQVAQNFAEPMSSALHFAQFMAVRSVGCSSRDLHVGSPRPIAQENVSSASGRRFSSGNGR
jgi:hypothetical protein